MSIESSNDPGTFHDFEHKNWQASMDGYQHHFAELTRQTVPALLDAAEVRAGVRVLDVCTGPGMLAEAALMREADAVGLDFSSAAVELAKRNVPTGEFYEGDAQALPFEDDSFDSVVCGYGVIHLPNPEKAMQEMVRVLRPSGRVAISVWEAPSPTNGFGVIFGAFKDHADPAVSLPHGPDFFQFSIPENLRAALETTGLHQATVQHVDQTWEFDEPLGIVRAVVEGTARARGLLLAQSDTVRSVIEAAMEKSMEQFRAADGGYKVPMPALVGAGAK